MVLVLRISGGRNVVREISHGGSWNFCGLGFPVLKIPTSPERDHNWAPATAVNCSRAICLEKTIREDGIACGCWPAELHLGFGVDPEFKHVGGSGYYHVPLPSIRAVDIDNLWLGGRVIGCDEQVYGSLRVMGTGFATGQAAGIAAAHCANGGAADDSAAIRAELLHQGAILG
jgi:hypothetical protein